MRREPGRVEVVRRVAEHEVVGAQLLLQRADRVDFLREERARGRRYDLVLVDPPYEEWQGQATKLAELLPDVLAADGLVVVETSERIEPELPLDLVTSRRYGSARITVFSR